MNDLKSKKTILIVAHPDDEILWFSSVVDKINEIIFCFHSSHAKPHLSLTRDQLMNNKPYDNLYSLKIPQSDTFGSANWATPLFNKYGIKIKNSKKAKNYKNNYNRLLVDLNRIVQNYETVITHNPWGDYGSEEHVQIYRVLDELQGKYNYELYFTNYVSNKSLLAMTKYMGMLDNAHFSLPVNNHKYNEVKRIYEKCGCWTWYKDWIGFENEIYISNKKSYISKNKISLNYINIHNNSKKPSSFLEFTRKSARQVFKWLHLTR